MKKEKTTLKYLCKNKYFDFLDDNIKKEDNYTIDGIDIITMKNCINKYRNVLTHLNFVTFEENKKIVLYYTEDSTLLRLSEFIQGCCARIYTVLIPTGDFRQILSNQVRNYLQNRKEMDLRKIKDEKDIFRCLTELILKK